MIRISVEDLIQLTGRALKKSGASKSAAAATARALVAANVEGLGTHGVARVALYCEHLRQGRANGKAKARVAKRKGATCVIDAGGGLAYEACSLAVKEAIRRAKRYGVAFCGITNSHHFGAAAYHVTPIAEAGLVGLAFSNSPAAINAWGGRKSLYGTNPIAAIFPRKGAAPLVMDMSLTEVARGRIMLYAKEGKPIPLGWAVDKDGSPTTDPQVALTTGSLSAIGGMKGTMLALIVELLCTALTGAAFSFENDSYFEPGNNPRIGHAILAIDPEGLVGGENYCQRLETLIARMLSDDGARLPGSRRQRAAADAMADGIEISEALHDELLTLAKGK